MTLVGAGASTNEGLGSSTIALGTGDGSGGIEEVEGVAEPLWLGVLGEVGLDSSTTSLVASVNTAPMSLMKAALLALMSATIALLLSIVAQMLLLKYLTINKILINPESRINEFSLQKLS